MGRLGFLWRTCVSLPAVAARPAAREPACPRAPSRWRAGWCRLKRAVARLEDSWLGDLIGVVSLFAILAFALLIGRGLGWN